MMTRREEEDLSEQLSAVNRLPLKFIGVFVLQTATFIAGIAWFIAKLESKVDLGFEYMARQISEIKSDRYYASQAEADWDRQGDFNKWVRDELTNNSRIHVDIEKRLGKLEDEQKERRNGQAIFSVR